MDKLTEKQIQDLIEKQLKSSKGLEDAYSPESQKEFSKYSGTREQFKQERKLRQITTGRKDTTTSQVLRVITAAVFGNEDLTDAVRSRFQERYTKEEIEDAKKTLREEFGIKEKKGGDAAVKRFKNIIKKEIDPIKDSIFGISEVVNRVGSDVKEMRQKFDTLNDRFKSMTNTVTQIFGIISARNSELNNASERMKPITVSGEEGQEYLYYPDAPPGRQIYEKSKTGTAGRIASKKVQRELKSELKRLNREENLKPIRASTGDESVDSIVDRIKVLLEEESMFRKRDMEELYRNLLETLEKRESAKLKPATASVFDLESDEQQRALTKALEKALEEIIAKNPDLFKSSSSFLPTPTVNPDIPGKTQKPGTPNKGPNAPDTGKKGVLGKLKDFALPALATLSGYGKGAAAALTSTAALAAAGAVAAGGSIFAGIDYGLKESGNKAIKNISKGSAQDIATAITVPKYGPYTLQELEKMAAEDPVLKEKLDQAKVIAGIVKTPRPVQMTLSPPKDNTGQQIVDQNQKRIEIQNAERVEIPSQTVNNINSTQVIPVPSTKKTIEVHNQENTFNRLLAQEFDHPATYASMNMG